MNDIDWELLDRYLAQEASLAERQEIRRWLGEDPDRARRLEAVRRAIRGLEEDVTPAELRRMWAALAEQASLEGQEQRVHDRDEHLAPGGLRSSGSRRAPWRKFGRVAAAVLAAGILWVAYQVLSTRFSTQGLQDTAVAVPWGKRTELYLPDSTRVLLAAGSTLRYPSEFGVDSRDVTLEGEAYFAVRDDQRRPFRVRAGHLLATDLGTEFIVLAFPEQLDTRVVVRSGVVAVRPLSGPDTTAPGRAVRAGELGRLGEGESLPTVELVDTASYFSWTSGILTFDDTPLQEALPRLSRWYDLDFRLADTSLGHIMLSGRLDQSLTASRLSLLAGSVGLRYTRHDREVVFYREAGDSSLP